MEKHIPSLIETAEGLSPTFIRALIFYSAPPHIWYVLKTYAQQTADAATPPVILTSTYLADITSVFQTFKDNKLITEPAEKGAIQQSALNFLKNLIQTGVISSAETDKTRKVSRNHFLAFSLDKDMSKFVTEFTKTISTSFPQADFSCMYSGKYSENTYPKLSEPSLLIVHLSHLLQRQDPQEAAASDEVFFPLAVSGTATMSEKQRRGYMNFLEKGEFIIREGRYNGRPEGYWLTPKGWDTLRAIQFIEKQLPPLPIL